MNQNSMRRPHKRTYCKPDMDCGPEPFIVELDKAAEKNPFFRAALWTGEHLQVTLMNIPAGGEVGLEAHPHLDQLLKIESGCGLAIMGGDRECLNYRVGVRAGCAIFVPAGTWHNLVNTGKRPIKLYSVYAPVQHPYGTVQETKRDADAAEAREGK